MRDLLVTAMIFGALPFVFKRPWIGVLLWSWISYMNPHRLAYGFAYDFPFALIVAIVTITAFLFSKEKKEMIWTRETVLLLMFIGWMLFTTFFAFYPESAWMEWNRVWKIQLFVVLTVILINDRQKLDWLIWVIVLSLGFYGVKGGVFTLASGGSYHVWGPPGSFIGENNALALALIMTIPLIWYLRLQASNRWIRHGLAVSMVLMAVSAMGSQSRGALLAITAMGFLLWLKSRHKLVTGLLMVVVVGVLAFNLPQSWYDRMNTIHTYEEDPSAIGRINAWHTSFNVASERIVGGGYNLLWEAATFLQYAPDPLKVHDAHSIYFEVLGEHGFIGLTLFLLMWLFAWFTASRVIRFCRKDPEKKWAADLSAMAQASLVGYAVGGAFLGLAYFDLPYHIMIIIVLTAKFVGLYGKPQKVMSADAAGSEYHLRAGKKSRRGSESNPLKLVAAKFIRPC
jgi:probable O-glycosylation ligase (exosortase A-associated)